MSKLKKEIKQTEQKLQAHNKIIKHQSHILYRYVHNPKMIAGAMITGLIGGYIIGRKKKTMALLGILMRKSIFSFKMYNNFKFLSRLF